MLLPLFLAAALAQPQAVPDPAAGAALAPPRAAKFVLRDAYRAPGGGGHLGRLIEIWSRERALGAVPHRIPADGLDACLPRERPGEIDATCLRERLPQTLSGEDGVPVVAIVARDSGRRQPVLNVACVGPSGTGTASIDVNRGGAFSQIAAVRAESRSAFARCIARALPGAAPTFDEWNTGPEGHAVYFYHRVSGDCAGFEFGIGRNATQGLWTMPLDRVSWTPVVPGRGHPAALAFTCAEGAQCITHARGGQTQRLAAFDVPFGLEAKARRTAARLERLRRACAA